MIIFQDSKIASSHANWVGSKFMDEGVSFNKNPFYLNGDFSLEEGQQVERLLMTLISRPFLKTDLKYQFSKVNDSLELNLPYRAIDSFFSTNGEMSLSKLTNDLSALLYTQMLNPKSKAGIFLVLHLKDVQFEGEQMDAIGMFMLSNKIEGLEFRKASERFNIYPSPKIFGLDNLDLGAIVLNKDSENGYRVLTHCSTGSHDLIMWKDEFLRLSAVNDSYLQTNNFMHLYKNFVINQLEQTHELDTMDQVNLLNKAIEYVSENDSIEVEDFSNSVLGPEISVLFNDYVKVWNDEFCYQIPETFTLSSSALKKVKSAYKKVIKLDKNFHLYVHGKSELVEQGFDESKGLNFYKVYYEHES